jgi:hypothetical protein
LGSTASLSAEPAPGGRWSVKRAGAWYAQRAWPVGFNYTPRYAINQLEMWQEGTFDPAVIDQELSWAAAIGFNMARVYLHDLPWQQDAAGFGQRIDRFLQIADKHGIAVMFVLFDDVWDPLPQPGTQREPRPGVHNSGWVQSPGATILGDLSAHDALEPYVRGILSRYGEDPRVAVWDLYNEPGNTNIISYRSTELDDKHQYSLALLQQVFAWARDENPDQPLTAGVWRNLGGQWQGLDPDDKVSPLFDYMLEHSDIVTFHSYLNADDTRALIEPLAALGRPMICTEYMARGHGSTFEAILPLFAEADIGAIHWGLVSGKTQTIYPWRSWFGLIRFWDGLFSDEPDPWHHDLLRGDGTPYRPNEAAFIRSVIDRVESDPEPH